MEFVLAGLVLVMWLGLTFAALGSIRQDFRDRKFPLGGTVGLGFLLTPVVALGAMALFSADDGDRPPAVRGSETPAAAGESESERLVREAKEADDSSDSYEYNQAPVGSAEYELCDEAETEWQQDQVSEATGIPC